MGVGLGMLSGYFGGWLGRRFPGAEHCQTCQGGQYRISHRCCPEQCKTHTGLVDATRYFAARIMYVARPTATTLPW